MGTWGPGPFDNDAAADFLDALRASPTRIVAKILREIARTPAGKYFDVDDGGAGWSACEMVALNFGYGDTAALDDHILDLAGKLRPKEEQRLLALEVLPRIADRTNSELAGLRREGSDGAQFDAEIGLVADLFNQTRTRSRQWITLRAMARPVGQIGTSLAGTHSPIAALHKSDSYLGFKGGAEMEYARGTSAGVTMRSQTASKMNS